jgi:hypothetical protein
MEYRYNPIIFFLRITIIMRAEINPYKLHQQGGGYSALHTKNIYDPRVRGRQTPLHVHTNIFDSRMPGENLDGVMPGTNHRLMLAAAFIALLAFTRCAPIAQTPEGITPAISPTAMPAISYASDQPEYTPGTPLYESGILRAVAYQSDLSDLPPYMQGELGGIDLDIFQKRGWHSVTTLWDMTDTGHSTVLLDGTTVLTGQRPETLFVGGKPHDQGDALLTNGVPSPDGKRFAYLHFDHSGSASAGPGVVVVLSDGSAVKIVDAQDPNWSEYREGGFIFTIPDPAGGSVIVFNNGELNFVPVYKDANHELRSPFLLSSNELIVARRSGNGTTDIILVDITTGSETTLAENPQLNGTAYIYGFEDTDPNTRLIGHISRSQTQTTLTVHEINNQNTRLITLPPEIKGVHFVSDKQSKSHYLIVGHSDYAVYIFDSDGMLVDGPEDLIVPYRPMIFSVAPYKPTH